MLVLTSEIVDAQIGEAKLVPKPTGPTVPSSTRPILAELAETSLFREFYQQL